MAKKSIIIIDDEIALAHMIKERLEYECGFEVEVAANGEQALVLVKDRHFDLAITDYNMPKIKGDELILLMRKMKPKMLMAIYSVFYDDASVISQQIQMSADLVLKKPFGDDDIKKITNLLKGESD